MKLKYRQIQERTKDIEIFGSLVNKWIYQRNELNEKRKIYFEQLYGINAQNYINENYPIINQEENGVIKNKKNYHKTVEEQLELIKNEIDKEILQEQNDENKNQRALYNNSDNIKQIFNQVEEKKEENKEENKETNIDNNNINNNDKNKNDKIMNDNENKDINENKSPEILNKE